MALMPGWNKREKANCLIEGEPMPNRVLHRNAEAGHKNCEKLPLLRPKRFGPSLKSVRRQVSFTINRPLARGRLIAAHEQKGCSRAAFCRKIPIKFCLQNGGFMTPEPSASNEGKEMNKLKIDLLLAEYKRHSDDVRVSVQSYSNKFTIFAVIVLSMLSYAFARPDIEQGFIFLLVSFFIVIVEKYAFLNTYLIAASASRIREIEKEISHLTNEKFVIAWDTHYASRLINTSMLISKKPIFLLNKMPHPITTTSTYVFLTLTFLLAFSAWKACLIFSFPFNLLYLIFIFASQVFAGIQGVWCINFGRNAEVLAYFPSIANDAIEKKRKRDAE
jgi:hypothetical protein